MFQRKKLFVMIPTLLLIPLLVGMIPLKLANKLARGGPYAQSQDKQGCGQKNHSAHSLISQNHFDALIVHSTALDQGLSYLEKLTFTGSESVHSHISFASIPLRC
jgi:hypothetical protein